MDWKDLNWWSFIIWWIEDGEDPIEAALREIKEETWFKNIKFIKKINWEEISHFYAEHKWVNRYALWKWLYFELENWDKEEVNENEKNLHEVTFIEKNKVKDFINLANHFEFWDRFLWEKAYTDDWILVNSDKFNWLTSDEARQKMAEFVEEKWIWKKKINYKLRDWLISRQRYWWSPIPIIYCEDCWEVPVPEKDLPVVLPTDVDFKPTWESPLVNSKTFHEVSCPKCEKKARRESDTMDTFVCSSWYYFRFADTKNNNEFCSKENIEKWLPVDMYMGWAEHTVLHLLYARFFTKALKKYGKIDFNEPFLKLRHQWMVLAEDWRKMSKSLWNVVNPDIITAEFWADTTRMYVMFMGALEDMKPWNSKNIIWIKRFLDKVWSLQNKIDKNISAKSELEVLVNKTIKKVWEDITNFGLNTAISALMILSNTLEKEDKIPQKLYEIFLTLLSPFAPHITEELWEQLWNESSIHLENWPVYDPNKLIDSTVKIAIQINWKVRDEIEVDFDSSEETVKNLAFEQETVKKYIEWNEIKKVVYVKNKLLSIVI